MRPRKAKRARRGTALYITVLSTALIVSLLGLTGLTIVRIERKQMADSTDRACARMYANSAVELALRMIASDADWRATYTNGVETTPQTLGANARGTLSWILNDTDGSLTDADTDLRLKGVGRVGNTVQVTDVKLKVTAFTCLGSTLHAADVLLIDGADLLNDFTSSSNGSVNETGGSHVYGTVEAVNTVAGDDYMGTVLTGIAPRSMPNDQVLDYYIAKGTPISILSLPGSGTRELKEVVLSPTSNPYGSTNSQGIYVIDCSGYSLKIKDCRIAGTIVLLNCTLDSKIGDDHIHWEPALPNYPSLLVSGSIQLKMKYTVDGLEENKWGNFNPPGTPFPFSGGTVDTDSDDKWPTEFKGLIYATGDVLIDGQPPRLHGVIVARNITVKHNTDQFTYDDTFLRDPPPGFQASEMRTVTRSWNWGAAP